MEEKQVFKRNYCSAANQFHILIRLIEIDLSSITPNPMEHLTFEAEKLNEIPQFQQVDYHLLLLTAHSNRDSPLIDSPLRTRLCQLQPQ